MLKKKIRIFKWSAPVWSLLALFIVGVAAAAFLVSITGSADLTAAGGADVSFASPECAVQVGAGQIDTCTLVDGILTIEASQLDDEARVRVNIHTTNNDLVLPAYFSMTMPDASAIDGVSEIDVNLPHGYELVAAGEVDITMYIYLADLVPQQVVDTINFEFVWTGTTP